MMVALAVTDRGKREFVGFEIYDNESKETWKRFLESLKIRGLTDPRLITSDAHDGILYAISRVFPDTPWQRCQTHFSRNILLHVPGKYQKAVKAELAEMYNCASIEEARAKRDSIIAEYSDVADKAMECLDLGFEDAMTVMVLPENFRRFLRTSNHLERLNKELKRRSNVIGVFPNVGSLNRIIGSVLVELNDVYAVEQKLNFGKKNLAHLEEYTPKLVLIAKEQQRLLVA
jgi:transposase-like protein